MLKTLAVQDYIKTIANLSLTLDVEKVKVSYIAKKLKVTNAAVSDMVKKLVKEDLIINHSYKGVELTDAGRVLGMRLIRHHRLWEVFLNKTLGVPWDQIHAEAENLEHAASVDLMDRIDAYLHYPTVDPHGNPIPCKDGQVVYKKDEVAIADMDIGTKYVITRFESLDSDYLGYITKQGFAVEQSLSVVQHLVFDGSSICCIKGTDLHVTADAAKKIFGVLQGN